MSNSLCPLLSVDCRRHEAVHCIDKKELKERIFSCFLKEKANEYCFEELFFTRHSKTIHCAFK